jgi:UrcA family protein
MHSITTTAQLRGLIATGIFSVLATGFSAVSAAADSDPVRTSILTYDDLSLSSPQDVDELYRRIRSEAAKVCSLPMEADLRVRMEEAACAHRAIRDAVIKVNEPTLFNVYNAKNSTPLPVMLAAGPAR